MLNLQWPNINKFDNAITFKYQIISLFWYIENFLEKGEIGVPL